MTILAEIGAFQAGLALGGASMVSIGPNNLMLMREGLVRGRMGLVATLVWASYIALIAASYLLAGSAGQISPTLREILTWGGLAAISWFALQSLRAAVAAGAIEDRTGRSENGRSCFVRVMAVVWMNPLTYVELLFIPAALGQSFGAADARLEFVGALVLMAALCCYAYAFGGRLIACLLRSRASLRLFDFASGLILSAVALSMAASLLAQVL